MSDADEHTDARAGEGPRPSAETEPPQRKEAAARRRRSDGTRRGDGLLDDGMRTLVQEIGRDKLAPDVTSQEVYYSRSLRIRRRIAEFLIDNEGSTWANLPELHARAANAAGCSTVTAARWVHQFTRVGSRHRLVETIDATWILERREIFK